MTNTELAELFLLRLYDLAEVGGHSRYHNLDDIAREFGVTDRIKVLNIGKTLVDRRLIYPAFTQTSTGARITGDGTLLVEAGGSTRVIAAFRHNPERFLISLDQSTHFHGPISGSNVAVHSNVHQQEAGLSPAIEGLLKALADQLSADASLNDARRREFLSDVETLRGELQRSQPRRGLLREILATLSDVSSIAQLVIQLRGLLPDLGGGGPV